MRANKFAATLLGSARDRMGSTLRGTLVDCIRVVARHFLWLP